MDKREQAVQRMLKMEREARKDDIKSKAAEGRLKEQIKKTNQGKVLEVDSDLASEEEDEEDASDEDDEDVDEDDDNSDGDGSEEDDDEEGEYDEEEDDDDSQSD